MLSDDLPSLYERTGNITDHNTLLINRGVLRAIEAASTQDVRAVLVQAVEALEDERLDATGYCSLLELSCHDKVTAAISSLRSAIQGAGSGDSSTLAGETVPGGAA